MIASSSGKSNPRVQPSSSPFRGAMSAREEKRVVVLGTVVRRQSEEVVEEMAEIAGYERARMTAQAPPTPPYPGRFRYSQRRPTRHHKPINPAPPPDPEQVRVAAIRQVEAAEREAHLLEEADRLIRRPRTPTPPRRVDDHYDLAKWSRQRWV